MSIATKATACGAAVESQGLKKGWESSRRRKSWPRQTGVIADVIMQQVCTELVEAIMILTVILEAETAWLILLAI